MLADFTRGERTGALVILGTMVVLGLAMAIAGRHDLLGIHGWIVFGISLALTFGAIRQLDLPEPSPNASPNIMTPPPAPASS